jgi:hypothetical protein
MPGDLPWWRLGRPPKGEGVDPETTVRKRRQKEELGPDWRPEIEAGDFVHDGAEHLGVEVTDLQSSSKRADLVRARELLGVLGVERYRLKVKDLSWELGKTADLCLRQSHGEFGGEGMIVFSERTSMSSIVGSADRVKQ